MSVAICFSPQQQAGSHQEVIDGNQNHRHPRDCNHGLIAHDAAHAGKRHKPDRSSNKKAGKKEKSRHHTAQLRRPDAGSHKWRTKAEPGQQTQCSRSKGFDGIHTQDRDPRKSLHVEDVPVPELGLGEALIAVMASAVNYNTVWSSIFSPVSTFAFLRRYGKLSGPTARHDLPYQVVGSDLAGVVLRTGPGVTVWKPGEEVVAHCLSVELESSDGHNDTMMDPEQRIWGFETNFGGLAELAIVKTNQLMPKPKHLTWEEAATPGLVNSTAFRQLVSRNGAGMKQGDNVLIWGASGGLGAYATQYALAGGAIPVCVVSSEAKAALCRSLGAELIIDRRAEGYQFWKDEHTQDPKEWKRLRGRNPE